MNTEQFAALATGDRIRQNGNGDSFAVDGNYGAHVSAVRVTHVSNATEWESGGVTLADIQSLQRGDLLTNKATGSQCVVAFTQGGVALAVQALLLSEQDATDWVVVAKAALTVGK